MGPYVKEDLPPIPFVDVRRGGPPEHARLRRSAMLALRASCLSVLPRPLQAIVGPADRISSSWLRRSPSPYVAELEEIAAIAGQPGVWFVNASYEWGCTTRIDAEAAPSLWRTLDWPFQGLGRHVEVAMQEGPAGPFYNVTWPGAAGVLTGLAPGRFAAAINQAPLFRRSRADALLPADILLNAISAWRRSDRWPAAHLLRHVFETCRSFEEAVTLLSRTPVAKPVLFSLAGAAPGKGCLIERTETAAAIHWGSVAVANDWHAAGTWRSRFWVDRGIVVRGVANSDERCALLTSRAFAEPFEWLEAPRRESDDAARGRGVTCRREAAGGRVRAGTLLADRRRAGDIALRSGVRGRTGRRDVHRLLDPASRLSIAPWSRNATRRYFKHISRGKLVSVSAPRSVMRMVSLISMPQPCIHMPRMAWNDVARAKAQSCRQDAG